MRDFQDGVAGDAGSVAGVVAVAGSQNSEKAMVLGGQGHTSEDSHMGCVDTVVDRTWVGTSWAEQLARGLVVVVVLEDSAEESRQCIHDSLFHVNKIDMER